MNDSSKERLPLQFQTSEVPPASEVLFDDLTDTEGGEATVVTLTVADAEGERLDKWLAVQLPERSRAEIQRWIEAGLVTRGAKVLKASYRLSARDVIAVVLPAPADYAVEPEPIPLDVVYEDADLLVINKPAGMVVHPAVGHWHGTLVNAVLYHCPDLEGVGGAHRPGIVHRLDKDTSGLILVAKNDATHRALQVQFRDHTVRKTYLALIHGWLTPERGAINAPIGRDPRQRQQMAVVSLAQGRMAVTEYEVVNYHGEAARSGDRPQQPSEDRPQRVTDARFTLVACHPLTGRTHQIRVHLAHIRHPIVGDETYGGNRKAVLSCPRQFLHAAGIRFRLPSSGEEVEFAVPLPADLQGVLDQLQVAR